MDQILLNHIKLGSIKCLRDSSASFIKVLGLPYGTIPQRFSRSLRTRGLFEPQGGRYHEGVFDATRPGSSSIQPWGSVKSDASNIPLLTDNLPDDEEQSEDCLNLSIHLPAACIDDDNKFRSDAKLPVLVFIHGGAFFLGSANRPYYNPTSLVSHAIERQTPIIYVAINYRLGSLGFWHSNQAANLVPENNGLHDQDLAFEWMRENITDFGGDVENITVIGQSAGGESISVQTMRKPLFKRAIMFSGTPVTMPAMTHEEHHRNFLKQAEKLGIPVKDNDGRERDASDIANDVIEIDVSKIRDLAWVGLPCTNSTFFPNEKVSMQLIHRGKLAPSDWKKWAKPVEAQIVGTTTYDGGISFNMMSKDESRSNHASTFRLIAEDVLGSGDGNKLCEIYGIKDENEDRDALQRICLFESDIGFFAAALSVVQNSLVEKSYFHIFDLPNPFHGPTLEQGSFATHTFDIVTLLGGFHEDRLPKHYKPVVSRWRDVILDFIVKGAPPCDRCLGDGHTGPNALLVDEQGVREVQSKDYLENDERRRSRLFELAESIAGDAGRDVLWIDVCRRFLMLGD